tara:strand:- start:11943 stop:13103 length:1161 start_codon:yes stop_codon:yes gene_type:complete
MLNFRESIPLSLYIHLPWCVKKCPYCDFNSHEFSAAGFEEENYIEALIRDLDSELPRIWGRTINTVFIGGGTPSLFSPESLDKILSAIRSRLNIHPAIEITLEANPGTAEAEKFQRFREIGINRLSLGVQSFDDKHLKALGRIHDAGQAHHAVELAQEAGFENYNIDLMFGLPGQTINEALYDIDKAVAHSPTHISWYQLTIEPNTVFNSRPPILPSDDDIWSMQDQGQSFLENEGFKQYEISAYAKEKHPALHNLNYWQFGDYLGIGAGAHGKITNVAQGKIERFTRHKIPKRYIELAGTDAAITKTRTLVSDELALEFVMNAFRLVEGVPAHFFSERTGLTLKSAEKELTLAEERGLIEWQLNELRPSAKGLRYLNELLEIFVQ